MSTIQRSCALVGARCALNEGTARFRTVKSIEQSMQVWLAWMRGLEEKGHLKTPGQPLGHTGKVVRGKEKAVTDGPYIEVKDLVAGFIIVEARDLAQAAELAKGCPMLEGGGTVEVRRVDEAVLGLNRKLDPDRATRWRGARPE